MPTRRVFLGQLISAAVAARATPVAQTDPPQEISGVYPALAMFNDERECGTGAVVAWAGRLWAITYGPHLVHESSDRLYEITPDLRQIVRPESVGGTNANRLIHRESQQLFIGPYAIDASGRVRVISRSAMPGRLTGTARHLTHPEARVYFATMEEGLYDVDVRSLEVTGLIKDGNGGATSPERPASIASSLPGYHGKGLYTGQGRLVYTNNGEPGDRAQRDPRTTSGALAEWRGAGDWSMVRRNQFTEATGPGGIEGAHAESDPIWSIGWDHRSLILMVLDGGAWSAYRLPKASHSYDGAHGWNTEWPRIREIGDGDALMTMHGMMWRFPLTFSRQRSGGIAPRSTYLKVVGDFCRWRDRVVFGCDDTAAAEFLNVRRAKGKIAGPGQSQSNLWFVAPSRLDRLGPSAGCGAVWSDEAVEAGAVSDPFLFDGFARRAVHLAHGAGATVSFVFEIDRDGRDRWTPLRSVDVPASGYAWVDFTDAERAAWVRVRLPRAAAGVTALFTLANADRRPTAASSIFDGLALTTDTVGDGRSPARPRWRPADARRGRGSRDRRWRCGRRLLRARRTSSSRTGGSAAPGRRRHGFAPTSRFRAMSSPSSGARCSSSTMPAAGGGCRAATRRSMRRERSVPNVSIARCAPSAISSTATARSTSCRRRTRAASPRFGR